MPTAKHTHLVLQGPLPATPPGRPRPESPRPKPRGHGGLTARQPAGGASRRLDDQDSESESPHKPQLCYLFAL